MMPSPNSGRPTGTPKSPKNPKEPGSKKILGGKTLYFVFFTLAALWALSYMGDVSKSRMVPYSEIKQEIKEGRVTRVFITNETIEATTTETGDKSKLVAIRVPDEGLVKLLEDKKVSYEGRNNDNWVRDLLVTWVLPFVFIFLIWQLVVGRMFKQGGPPGLMTFGKSKARLVAPEKEKTTFKDVAGVDEAKEELTEVIDFLKKPDKFTAIGGRIPKGVLLVGPPGTGKTLLARAVAGEAGVAFFQISGSDFVEMFVGVGAARVRDLFKDAQKNSPCIVFIDELDAIAKSRSSVGGFQGNDEREQTLNQILVEMDGFDNHNGVIIMAATNRPEVLDPAILRPGRFDRQITVDRPDKAGREQILKVHARQVKIEENINFLDIAARTPGFSGADLANVVNEAALLAVRKGLETVNKSCFEDAIDRVVAGLARKSRVINEKEKRTIAIHEVGHAIVAQFTAGADRVHRISIVPRSSGALGFTMQIPEEDRHLMSERQLRDMVRVLLGGRAAEKTIMGEVTSGASDDLKRASSIIRRMILEFGMSESLGLVSLANRQPGYLDNPFIRDDSLPVGAELATEIDKEIRKVLDEEFESACSLVRNHRKVIDNLTRLLLEKETLEREDFDRLVADYELERRQVITT